CPPPGRELHEATGARISGQRAGAGAGVESCARRIAEPSRALNVAVTSMRWIEYVVFLAIVVGLAQPVGLYLARVGQRRRTFLDPLLRPIESLLYRLLGVRREEEMSAGVYIICFLLFGAGCTIVLFLVLVFQRWLPGGPADAYLTTPMSTDLAGNTAVSLPTTP